MDVNNQWKKDSLNLLNQELLQTYLKKTYLEENIIGKKLNSNNIYKIISETCKTKLDSGIFNDKFNNFTSTTLLNQDNIYDGLTNIELIIVQDNENLEKIIDVENIKIRSRAKNTENSYRFIEWNLEFDKTQNGYKILGVDNFIHMSLIGLDNIFLDITYKLNVNNENNYNKKILVQNYFELKYTKCLYNYIIKNNLKKYLYENEENYFVDIIDNVVEFTVNLDQEKKIFGKIYNIDYNILRIMGGIGGIAYAN